MSPDYLNVTDYTVIIGYLSVMLALGYVLKKRASASLENYFLGGREVPWWMMGMSGAAQFIDVTGTMIIVSFLFLLGPRGLFIEFRGGAALLLVVFMLWTGKWHRRSKCLTGAEWMIYRFGDGPGGRFAQFAKAMAGIVSTLGMIAYLAKGVGLFLSMFLPFTPMACATGMFASAALFTMFSGFFGVVLTAVLQFVIIAVAAALIVATSLPKIPNLERLAALAESVTQNPHWVEALPRVQTNMPPGYEIYESLLMFATIYVVRNVVYGMGTGDDPKYFGSRTDADCSKLTFLWISLLTIRWPAMIAIASLGLLLVDETVPNAAKLDRAAMAVKEHAAVTEESWPEVISRIANRPDDQPTQLTAALHAALGEKWPTTLLLVSYHGSVNPERIMPAVLLHYVPEGARGFMLVALIAASMSSFNAWVNGTSALFARDIYQKHLRPTASIRELIAATWIFIACLVSAGLAFAFFVKNINDIWGWIIMSLGGGLMMPQTLRFYWSRFNGVGFAVGSLVGMAAAVVQRLTVSRLPEAWRFLGDEQWAVLLTASVSLTAAIAASLLSKPTPQAVLRNFYFTTLPFGAWSKFKHELPAPLRQRITREHRQDILAIPTALAYQIMIYLTPMLMVIGNWSAAWICLIIGCAAFALLYFGWLRHIAQADRNVIDVQHYLARQRHG